MKYHEIKKKICKKTVCKWFGHKWEPFHEYRRIGVNEFSHGYRCAHCGKLKIEHTEKL